MTQNESDKLIELIQEYGAAKLALGMAYKTYDDAQWEEAQKPADKAYRELLDFVLRQSRIK